MKSFVSLLLAAGAYVFLCVVAPELAMALLFLLVIAGPWLYGALRRAGR